MAALAAIADESLRLYPDPVSTRPARRPPPPGSASRADQVLAGNGSDDCLTILYRGFLDAGRARRLPVADLRPLRHAGVAAGRRAGAGAVPAERPPLGAARRSGRPAREDDHPRQPQQPVGDAGARRRAARACATPRGRRGRRRRRGLRRLRAGRRASTPACCPTSTQHPNLVVLRTMSKSYSLAGARLGLLFAAAPLVAELIKVKDSYNVNAVTQAIGVAALEDRSYHERLRAPDAGPARAPGARARRRSGLTWPESAANFLLCEIGERAEAIYRRAQGGGPAGALVAGARAAHEAPHQRRQSRRERPPARRAQAPGVTPKRACRDSMNDRPTFRHVRQAGHIGKLTIVIP